MIYCTYNLGNPPTWTSYTFKTFDTLCPPHRQRHTIIYLPEKRNIHYTSKHELYIFILTALHAIWGNNTNIVTSSWWWAYNCTKNVEQIASALYHSVVSSWLYSVRIYDARTNIHQICRDFILLITYWILFGSEYNSTLWFKQHTL